MTAGSAYVTEIAAADPLPRELQVLHTPMREPEPLPDPDLPPEPVFRTNDPYLTPEPELEASL